MADNDDFKLEEEGEDLFAQVGRSSADADRSRDLEQEQQLRDSLHNSTGTGDEKPEEGELSGRFEPSPVAKKDENQGSAKTPVTRVILLVVLLLVAAGAAGYFYLGLPSEPARQATSAPPKKPIAVPPRPEPAPVPQPEKPSENKAATTEVDPARAERERAQSSAATSSEPAPADKTVAEENVVAKPVAAVSPVVVPQKTPADALSPEGAGYFLESGTFLRSGDLETAENRIRELGFQPRSSTEKKAVPMTRLLNGVFPPAQGKTRLAELKKLAPGAFILRRDGKLAVFAGSFSNPENARQAADELREAGIRTTEEPASAELPVSVTRFGPFATREEAEGIAEKARDIGLEVEIARSQ